LLSAPDRCTRLHVRARARVRGADSELPTRSPSLSFLSPPFFCISYSFACLLLKRCCGSSSSLAPVPSLQRTWSRDNGDPAALSKDEVIVAYPFVEASLRSAWRMNCTARHRANPRMMTNGRTPARHGPSPGRAHRYPLLRRPLHGTVVGETRHRQSCERCTRRGWWRAPWPLGSNYAARRPSHRRGRRHDLCWRHNRGRRHVVGAGSTIGANAFLTHSVPALSWSGR